MNMKESPYTSKTASAYYVNQDNQELINKGEKVAYSEDKTIAIVYTEEDVNHQIKVFEAIWELEQLEKRSYEDEIYESFLQETGVEEQKPVPKQQFAIMVDPNDEMLVNFKSKEEVLNCCIINKKDAKKGGSKVIFVIPFENSDGEMVKDSAAYTEI